jgi:GNAT superfamily N-acetyltransferase
MIDADGKEYIRYLRKMANSRLFHFAYENSTQRPISVEGFVWEVEKRIVGNLTLIPFLNENIPHYLIANVAVHPDFRLKGIAHELTHAALQEAKKHMPCSIWLHVRDDNQAAIHLYESLGFVERTRRSNWELSPDMQVSKINSSGKIHPRFRTEWIKQKEWLDNTYPMNIRWNLQLNEKRFSPGIWGQVKYWFISNPLIHYSQTQSQVLEGIITFESTARRSNTLWLACLPENDATVIKYLIPASLKHFPEHRPLSVNYPAGRGILAFIANGWKNQNTLIWMEYKN